MKKFIQNKLRENLGIPSLRVPKNTTVSSSDIVAIKNLQWTDIKIDDLGGDGNIAHLAITLPIDTPITQGIVVDIQVLRGMIYQIHIHMAEQLQGLGLGYKIYKALIADLGHLYSGKGRRMNPNVTKIWEKLKTDPSISCVSNSNGDLCMKKGNPDAEDLIDFMN